MVTTDSDHEFEVYLNLASRMKLTGINQLWVADITYIRLKNEFVYLAVVLDAFSRKVVGWALDRTLASRLADRGAGAGHRPTTAAARSGASFRPWCAVRLRRLRPGLAKAPDDPEHESAGEPVRQRQLRKLYEDAETGRNLRERLRDLDHLRRTSKYSSSSITIGAGCIRRWATERRRSSNDKSSAETETADAKAATITFVAGLAQSSTGMLEQGTQTEGVTKPAAMWL